MLLLTGDSLSFTMKLHGQSVRIAMPTLHTGRINAALAAAAAAYELVLVCKILSQHLKKSLLFPVGMNHFQHEKAAE